MSDCRVNDCGTPCQGTAIVCQRCTDRLERALGDVRSLTDELVTTTTRFDRIPTDSASPPQIDPAEKRLPLTCKPQRLPFHWDAADLAWALQNTLTTWARVLLEHVEFVHGPACPDCLHTSCNRRRSQQPHRSDPATVATWLLGRLDIIRHHEAGPEMVDEVTACVRAVERAIDRHREQWYAGPCGGNGECTTELYAAPTATTVHCRDCGTDWDMAERRAWLLNAAEDAHAHAELIAKAATSLGEPITPAMIRGYAYRNRIWARSVDFLGRPLYRVGDVLEVLRDTLKRKAERSTQREKRCA